MGNKLFTLPNCITLANLACGCVATVVALLPDTAGSVRLDLAFWFVAAAAVFDFADGMTARLTHQYSTIGIELDSLADVVSFGVAPSTVLFTAYNSSSAFWAGPTALYDSLGWGVFIVALFSALRLARFNASALEVDAASKTGFIGLPVPASALAIAALGAMWFETQFPAPREAILLIALVTSIFLISRLRMFSLKFIGFGWRGNEIRYVFLTLCATLIILFGLGGIPLSVALYMLLSVIRRKND